MRIVIRRGGGGCDVRELQIRNARQATQEVGKEAKIRQAILYCAQRNAEVGQHHVCPGHFYECHYLPRKDGLAS